ncbi:hypothetical protein [Billgrantia aerodenitrificans]|jgi:hypothetical protein|uniref:Uncharacterized protein n=1 Tax=Billgrantia aerodenitrificans TaxID=2733483 RepID=A0ABS9AVQ5_9GAMM|nr:hypothetical protein [Halomonas aerodenitrificans]MCE8025831.1 hypothetical protein [Halomonas aerodenitrificans]
MAEFQREHRYWVVKRKHLTPELDEELRLWLEQIGHPPMECVCVESGWPIYEETWENVQRMAGGRPSIGQERDALETRLRHREGLVRRAIQKEEQYSTAPWRRMWSGCPSCWSAP